MSKMRSLIFTFGLLLFAATTVSEAQNFTAPDGVVLLTEQELRNVFVGNTAAYPSGGREWCSEGGSCRGKRGSFSWSGNVAFDGNLVCFTYPDNPGSGGCRTVSQNDDGTINMWDAETGGLKFENVKIHKGKWYI